MLERRQRKYLIGKASSSVRLRRLTSDDPVSQFQCRFWGQQFDCSMCPTTTVEKGTSKNDNVQIVEDCTRHKQENIELKKAKQLMVVELRSALNDMILDQSISRQQKKILMEKLGMEDVQEISETNSGIMAEDANVFVVGSDQQKDARTTPVNFETSYVNGKYNVVPYVPLGDYSKIHKILRLRRNRLKRKYGGTRRFKHNIGNDVKLILKEEYRLHGKKVTLKQYKVKRKYRGNRGRVP